MFRALFVIAIVCLSGFAAWAEPCTARQLLSEVGAQYAQLHTGAYRKQREAARALNRLLPRDDVYQFSLQLSAEGHGVDPRRLRIAFAQIEKDIKAFRTGLPIGPLQTFMRVIFPLTPVDVVCAPPLKDMPTLVSERQSMGSDGAKNKATKADRLKHVQRPKGGLLPFSLTAAPRSLMITIAAITSLLIVAGVLCRRRIVGKFGRRSRLPRRSVTTDFCISWHGGKSVSVSSVDISTEGMKIALRPDMSDQLHVGDQIVLHLPGQDVWATIVWCNKFYCGVAFHRRLRNRDFRKIIGEMLLRA